MKSMEGPIDDSAMFELLGRQLAGEITPDETAMLDHWLAAAPENRQTLEALQEIWAKVPATPPAADGSADATNAAWARMQARMHAAPAAPTQESEAPEQADRAQVVMRPEPRRSGFSWWRVAAMLAVALSIGMVIYLNQIRKQPMTELVTLASGEMPLSDTLPDGTVVYLNAHSQLQYPKAFAAGERVVQMDGEGFFEVAHDAAHPFRIHAGEADVRVLGTSFNLSTRGAQVRVAVQTGRVELSARDSVAGQARARTLVVAGSAATFDRKRKSVQQEQGEVENDQFWRTGKLVFRAAPLQRVVAQLNAVFADSIVLGNPALADCQLNTTFEKPSIDSVLAVIAETFDLKVTVNGKNYTLDGEACH